MLVCKQTQPVHSKGGQPWDFFGRNDAKAETPVLWPPHAKSWLIGKDSDAGRDWGQGEKGMTEDEMAGWRHRLDGCESEWTPEVGDGQAGLACWDSWGHRVGHDWATELNWTESWVRWSQEGWFLQLHSSFSRLLWLFGVFCVSMWIVKFFVLKWTMSQWTMKNVTSNLIQITVNL